MAFFILLAAAAVTSGDEYVTRRYQSRYSPYEFEYTVRRRPSYRDVRHNRKGSLRILFVCPPCRSKISLFRFKSSF